ncbi:hypothetical protein [Telmatospirillum sp. J64-1]|uniref:virion core protein, T7 gp14 family n=1 Tax=Telmatospirillum sp. J64-1 TaxID=2502183 RepID=UPI00115E2643|nr:hypothetical protein [Telmatospirillum sp. J64-1]
MALQIVGSVAGHMGQKQAAKDYNRIAAANYRDEVAYREALKAYNQRVFESNRSQLLLRMQEEQVSAAYLIEDAARQAAKAKAAQTVRAGESGLSGRAVDMVLGDIMRQRGEATTMALMNLDATQRQITSQLQGLAPEPVGPAARPVYQRSPGALSLIGDIGSSLIGGMHAYHQWTGKNPLEIFKLGS